MLSLVATAAQAQPRGPGLTPEIKTLADGTRVTTYRDQYGLVRVQREFPNHTIEVENYKSQTRTIMWPDGGTDEMRIDVHARWTNNQDGSRAYVDGNNRIVEVQYPDGSSMRFDYEKFSPSNRVLGVTVRGPESEGSPILQQMTRGAYSQDFKNPNFKQIADAEAKKRFDFTTRDADGKVTTTTADAYYDPKTNALTLSNALETTRLYPDGTRQVDDNLQGTTRTFDANGRITKIETNPGNRNNYHPKSATIAYDDKGLSQIDVAGMGTIERQPDGSWKLPDGTKVNGELVIGKGMVTIVGPTDASGNRRVDQFRFDDQEQGHQKFTQGPDQAKYLADVAKKLGAGDGAQGAATVMELLEATQRAQDARDRKFSDAINTAAYKLNGERPDGGYPPDLKTARKLSDDVRRMLNERKDLADKKDYKGLATSDLTSRINETEDAAREKLEKYIPTLGEVAQRIIDDLPAKIGGKINYAIEHPFKTIGGLAIGLAVSIIAPELALAVGVGSLGINAVGAGGEIVAGYVNHDPGMVWHGASGAGDAILEGGEMIATHAAFKGLGALGKPIVAKLMPKRVVPETFTAAKMEGPVRAPVEPVVTETPGVGLKGPKGGGLGGIEPRKISLPIIEPPPTRCFVAGTQVLVLGPSGIASRNIEEISEGDVVVAQDAEEGETHLRPVTNTFAHLTHDLRVVTARDAAGHEQSIETTDGHRFFAEGLGFVRADALGSGTRLRTAAEPSTVMSSLARTDAKGVIVYNFEVEGDHDYFVSAHADDVAVLVHNDCIDNVLTALEKTDPLKAAQARKGLVDLEGSNQSGKVKELLANLADNKFGKNQSKAEAEVVDALIAVADGKQVVATPWGLARQHPGDTAIAARVEISGQGKRTVYRLGTAAKTDPKTGKPIGGSEGVDGQFWARENPLTNPNYARDYGIPQVNIDKADFIEVGVINEGAPYITRPAPASHSEPHLHGGGIEVVVPPNGVKVQSLTIGKGGTHDLHDLSTLRPGPCATPAAPPH